MKDRDKIREYLRSEMKEVLRNVNPDVGRTTFHFCFSQAKFDALMDIDLLLKLEAFYKRSTKTRKKKIRGE